MDIFEHRNAIHCRLKSVSDHIKHLVILDGINYLTALDRSKFVRIERVTLPE